MREDALNWWLFQNPKTLPNIEKFLSYEVPLASDRDDQLKLDLLGVGKDGELILAELKKGENESDSPLMALTELICYIIQLKRCLKKAKYRTALADSMDMEGELSAVSLYLVAPARYWEYWDCLKPERWAALRAIVARIAKILEFQVQLKGWSITSNDKVEQLCPP